jgi:hypothetical protein
MTNEPHNPNADENDVDDGTKTEGAPTKDTEGAPTKDKEKIVRPPMIVVPGPSKWARVLPWNWTGNR